MLVTLGIYQIYWEVVTKIEMTKKGADIPTSWLIIIPIVNLWWAYKYCTGVEKVTNGKMSGVLALVLYFCLSIIGLAIIQDAFNKVDAVPTISQLNPQGPLQNNQFTSTSQPQSTPASTFTSSDQLQTQYQQPPTNPSLPLSLV